LSTRRTWNASAFPPVSEHSEVGGRAEGGSINEKEKNMRLYTVKTKLREDNEPGAFCNLRHLDCEFEYIGSNSDSELHRIRTEQAIDALLDQADGVISYWCKEAA